jgi:hypothetical protein
MVEGAGERVARLETRMTAVETAILSLAESEKTVRDFITDLKARRDERDKVDRDRARIHFTLLGGLISLVVGLILWFVGWTVNFEKHHHVTQDSPPAIHEKSTPDVGDSR